jgi:hypothetical protein
MKTETDPASLPLPSLEPWRAKYMVPSIYRNTNDKEWAGY